MGAYDFYAKPVDIDGSTGLASVSCANPSFCVAVDKLGRVLTYR